MKLELQTQFSRIYIISYFIKICDYFDIIQNNSAQTAVTHLNVSVI